ncbi:MAG TPA: strawberry notch family protein [Bacteroidota bacterium]|nr:strawberry notch family protein [Bacteroidota bacterium]
MNPQEPRLAIARSLRQYVPHLADMSDDDVLRSIDEVYQSGDPAYIGNLVNDLRRYVPRYSKMDSTSVANEMGGYFQAPQAPAGSRVQPARPVGDYMTEEWTRMFGGEEPTAPGMLNIMRGVTAPFVPSVDIASASTPAKPKRLFPTATAGASAAPTKPEPGKIRTAKDVQEKEFDKQIGQAQKRKAARLFQLPALSPIEQQGGVALPSETIPPVNFGSPEQAFGDPNVAPMAAGINRSFPIPGAQPDGWGDVPTELRLWPDPAPASMVSGDIGRTFEGEDPKAMFKRVREFSAGKVAELERQLAAIPPAKWRTDPSAGAYEVHDQYSGKRRALNEALTQYRAILDMPEDDNPAEVLRGLYAGFMEAPEELFPFVGDAIAGLRSWRMGDVERRVAEGKATPEEKEMFDAEVVRKQFEAETRAPFYRGGQMVGPMLPYAGKFKILEPVRDKAEQFISRQLFRAFGGKRGVRDMSRIVAPIVGGATAGAVDVPGIARGMAERMQGQYEYGLSPAGEVVYRQIAKGDPILDAALKGLASNMAEMGTESAGESLIALKRALVGRYMQKANIRATDVEKAVAKVKEGIGWQGIIYEIAEEELNEPIQAWIDNRQYDDPITSEKGRDRLLTELVGIGLFGSPFTIVNQAGRIANRRGLGKPSDVKAQAMAVAGAVKQAPEKTGYYDPATNTFYSPEQLQGMRRVGEFQDRLAQGKSELEQARGPQSFGSEKRMGRAPNRAGAASQQAAPEMPPVSQFEGVEGDLIAPFLGQSITIPGVDSGRPVTVAEQQDDPSLVTLRLSDQSFRAPGTTVQIGRQQFFNMMANVDRPIDAASDKTGGAKPATPQGATTSGNAGIDTGPDGARTDFQDYLKSTGLTPAQHYAASRSEKDIIPQPKADLDRVYLSNSPIHGQGVFTYNEHPAGDVIATALDEKGNRTNFVGRYINHSNDPNVSVEQQQDGSYAIVARRPLGEGEELTMDYRQQESIAGGILDVSKPAAAPSEAARKTRERADIVKRLRSGELDPVEAVRMYEKDHPKLRTWAAWNEARKPINTLTYKGKKANVLRSPDGGYDVIGVKGNEFLGNLSDQEYAKMLDTRGKRSAVAQKKAGEMVLITPEALESMPATKAIFGSGVGDITGDMLDNVKVGSNPVRAKNLVKKDGPLTYDKIRERLLESDNPTHQAWLAEGLDWEDIYDKALEEIAQYQGGKIPKAPVTEPDNPMADVTTYLDSLKPDEFVRVWQSVGDEQKKQYLGDDYQDMTVDEIAQLKRVNVNGEWYDVKQEGGPEGELILEDGTTLSFDRVFSADVKLPVQDVEKGTAAASQAPDTVRAAEDTAAAPISNEGSLFGDIPQGSRKLTPEQEFATKNPGQAAQGARNARQEERRKAVADARARMAKLKEELALHRRELPLARPEQKPKVQDAIRQTLAKMRALQKVIGDAPIVEEIEKQNAPDMFAVEEGPAAGQTVAADPSEGQKEAGNYKKAHVRVQGLDISIENPKGTTRSGVDRDGKRWETEMKSDYGYIRGTEGKDKDHIDVFIGPNPDSDFVLVVNQKNEDGKFDEHKIMLGFGSREEAEEGYLANYAPNWLKKQGGKLDAVETNVADMKDWLRSGETKKPHPANDPMVLPVTETLSPELLARDWRKRRGEKVVLNVLGSQRPGEYTVAEDQSGLTQKERHVVRLVAPDGGIRLVDARNIREIKREEQALPTPAAELTPQEKAKQELEELKKKFLQQTGNTLTAGIDPAAMATAVQIALKYTELGVYKFADFAKAAYELVGDAITPYLKGAYMAAKQHLDREARKQMDTEDAVDDANLDALLSSAEQQTPPKPEAPAKKPVVESASLKRPNNWLRNSAVRNVVYHGTADDIDVFSNDGLANGGVWGTAFYLTADPTDAEDWAAGAVDVRGGSPSIMPLWVRIENPFYIDRPEARRAALAEARKQGIDIPASVLPWLEGKAEQGLDASIWAEENLADIVKAMGHDGIIGTIDGVENYAVFSNEQIRSATANTSDTESESPSEPKEPAKTPEKQPAATQAAPESREGANDKDPDAPTQFREGDRVVFNSNAFDVYRGRHGVIVDVSIETFSMVPMFGAGTSERMRSVRYEVKTDGGLLAISNADDLGLEEGAAPEVVPDVKVSKGEIEPQYMAPADVVRQIRRHQNTIDNLKSAASRARKQEIIRRYEVDARWHGEKRDDLIEALRKWGTEHPKELRDIGEDATLRKHGLGDLLGESTPAAAPSAKPAGAEPPAADQMEAARRVLAAAGLKVTATTTNNGKPVWEVSGNTKTHLDHMKALRGRWYGPKKVWSFYAADPSIDLAKRLDPTAMTARPATPAEPTPQATPAVDTNRSIVKRVESATTESARSNIFAELGSKAVPGLRMQEHEEAGRWVYLVAKGEVAQSEFDAKIEEWRRENRIRQNEQTPKDTPVMPPEERPIPTFATAPRTEPVERMEAIESLRDAVYERLSMGLSLNNTMFWQMADRAFGASRAEDGYDVKDAYDALEAAVNTYIIEKELFPGRNIAETRAVLERIRQVLPLIPTQNVRTAESDEFQQFSTVPHIALLANWLANLRRDDVYLEPSAGVGGLASFAVGDVAEIILNELSDRRADILEQTLGEVENGPKMQFFRENAEQLDNILDDSVVPTVVVMNPPFSSTAGAVQGERDTMNSTLHLDQMLRRLPEGGRLVAVLGEGATMSAETTDPAGRQPTGAKLAPWWRETMKKYNVRANVGIAGKEYAKYGTGWPVRIVVIDKDGPTPGGGVYQKFYNTIEEALADSELRRIRDERPATELPDQPAGAGSAAGTQGTGGQKLPTDTRPDVVGTGEQRPAPGRGDAGGLQDVLGEDDGSPGKRNAVPDGRAARERELQQQGSKGTRKGSAGPALDGNDPRFRVDTGNLMEYTVDPDRSADAQQSDNLDSRFDRYVPSRMSIAGAKPHPGNIVESAAMASVKAVRPTYVPMFSKEFVESGILSEVQLEAVIYAGQAHEQHIDDGLRRGFFIGDGTGVGKGREIAGILLDNWNQGRRRHLWITKNQKLQADAERDILAVFGEKAGGLLHNLSDTKLDQNIAIDEGILFITYNTLIQESRTSAGRTRLKQIVDWLGKDFEGVIAFDEAHKMGTALDMKGKRGVKKASQTAIKAMDMVAAFPEARVVYASATGATDPTNLGYLDRIGLWGASTEFPTKLKFVEDVTGAGVAMMEYVARDMKAMGLYLARSLSYEDVTFETLTHALSPEQREIWNTLSDSWAVVLDNINDALELTASNSDGKVDGRVKARLMSQFWGANLRFWNQILLSMQLPSMIADIHKQIDAGNSVLIQLVNTYEAAQESKLSTADKEDLEALDMTPRESLMAMVERTFPVNEYREIEDENGNKRMELVLDSKGNPVQNREALRMRERLLDRLSQIVIPDAPLDAIITEFGADMVAEVTGRSRRVVRTYDTKSGRQKTIIEKRSSAKADVEADDFMNDRRKILIFSDAGGTGRSYHADRAAKNQRKRIHYVFQPGWVANMAIQGMGRSHRTNQAAAPHYVLVTTDLEGQKRFISTIARRLSQLGALTRGQRDAAGGSLFSERDNLESVESREALRQLYVDVWRGVVPNLTLAEFENKTSLKLTDKDGALLETLPPMSQFLNRLLNLGVDTQNLIFQALSSRIDAKIHEATLNGTLDLGMESVKAERAEVATSRIVHTDERTGAKTRYLRIRLFTKAVRREWETSGAEKAEKWVRNIRSGRVYAVFPSTNYTDAKTGKVLKRNVLASVTGTQYLPTTDVDDATKYEILSKNEAKAAWKKDYEAAPELKESELHMITGALLPVFSRLPSGGSIKVQRVKLDDGTSILGRVILEKDVNDMLRRLGAEGEQIEYAPEEVVARIVNDNYEAEFANGWRMRRRTVNGQDRIEFINTSLKSGDSQLLQNAGVVFERQSYESRHYLPTGRRGEEVLKKLAGLNKKIIAMYPPETGEGEVDAKSAVIHRAQRQSTGTSPTPPPTAIPTRRYSVPQPAAWTQTPTTTREAQRLEKRMRGDSKGERIGMRSIVDWLGRQVHAELRVGKEQTTRRNPAHFESDSAIMRSRYPSSAAYNMHEMGHAISGYLRDRHPNLFRGMVDDLKALATAPGSLASANSAEEGFAEWLRLFVTNYGAIDGLPVTQKIETVLEKDSPELMAALRDANRLHFLHAQRGAVAIRNSINNDKGLPPPFWSRALDSIDKILFEGVSSRHAIEHIRRMVWRQWKHGAGIPRMTGKTWAEYGRMIREYLAGRKSAVKQAREWEKRIANSPGNMMSAYVTVLRIPQEVDYFIRGTGRKEHSGQRVIATGDKRILTDEAIDTLEKAGYTIPVEMRDTSSMGKSWRARHGDYIFFHNRLIADVVTDVGPDNWEAFEQYVWDKTDLYRHEKLGMDYAGYSDGISPEDLRRQVADAEKAHPEWKDRYKELNDYMDNLAVIAVAGGLITADQAAAMKKKHEQYVPLLKEREREENGFGSSTGVQISAKYRRAHGSELPKIPLLNSIEIRTRQVLSAYYHNRMALAPVRLAEMTSNDNTVPYDVRKLVERMAVRLRLDTKKMATLGEEEARKVIAEYLTQQLHAEIRAREGEDADIPEEIKVTASDVVVHWSGMSIFRTTDPRAVHVIAPMVDGERAFYQIEDPILYDFFARSTKPVGKVARGIQRWVLPVVAPWKRQITQTLRFVLGNIPRDTVTAMFTGEGMKSLIPAYYHLTGLIYKLSGKVPDTATTGQLLARSFETAFDPAQLVRMNKFKQTLMEGLMVPGWGVMTRGERIMAIIKDAPGKLATLFMKPTELILWATGQRALAELSEESARLGAYRQAKNEGYSDEEAQMRYDIITGLFADRPGDNDIATFVRAPGFLNPTMQIMYGWLSRLTDPDPGVRNFHYLKIGYIGALTALGWAVNILLMGDDEYEKLKERPDEERFHFMPVGGLFKVPFDNGPLGATQMFVWNMMDHMAGGDPVEARKLATQTLKKMNSLPYTPTEFLSPQIVTWVELMANYKFYWDKQIVPQFMLALPAEEQYYTTTNEMYVRMGEYLGISPLKIEHAIRSGVSPQIDETFRLYSMIFGGEPLRKVDQIPGISTRMQHEPMGYNSRSVQQLAEKAEKFRSVVSSLKKHFGMPDNMRLSDAADWMYSNPNELTERQREQFDEAVKYYDYYRAFQTDEDSVERWYEQAKQARKRAIESRDPKDWETVDEYLRGMTEKARLALSNNQ